jgi:ABC-type dipeptide/oligopeptide/nickel transport system permease component
LVQAATLYLATAFVLINLAVDMLYAFLDPRIKQG